jgi:hypothetical protein
VRVSKASFRALSDPKGAFRTGNAARFETPRHAGNTIGGSTLSAVKDAFRAFDGPVGEARAA